MHSSQHLIFASNQKENESYLTINSVKEMSVIENKDTIVQKLSTEKKIIGFRKEQSPITKGSSFSLKSLVKVIEKPEHIEEEEKQEKNSTFKKRMTTIENIVKKPSFENIIFDKKRIKNLEKTFEEDLKIKDANKKFKCSETNLKGFLDSLIVENSSKKEILQKKEKKLEKLINGMDFAETLKNLDNTFGNFPTFTTEINQNNAIALYEVLNNKMVLLEKTKAIIIQEERVLQCLKFMKEKRKKNVIYFQNESHKIEKFIEIINSQKLIIDQKANDLKTDEILSKITISEFKKDLFANRKFNNEIINRKKILEKKDLFVLEKEMNTYLTESEKVKIYQETILEKKQIIKELDQRADFLKNVQIHVKNESLDYLDRISDIFVYNKPEDFILDNYLDLNIPLMRKNKIDSLETISNRVNSKPKFQRDFKKRHSSKIFTGLLGSSFKANNFKGNNLPSMALIRSITNGSNASININLKNDEEAKKNKGIEKETLMMRINEFYYKHNNDITKLTSYIIQEHTKLTFQEESLNKIIFDLTEQLRKLKKTYSKMVETLNDLIKQSQNADLGNDGLLMSKARSGSGEETILLDDFSTICGLKLEINGFQIDKTNEFILSQKFQIFIFHTYFFFQENVLRLLSILFTICQKTDHNHKLSALVKSLFEKMNENYEDIKKNEIYKQIKEMSNTHLFIQEKSIDLSEINESYEKMDDLETKNSDDKSEKKQKTELNTKFKDMQLKFYEFFPRFKSVFKEFLQLMQSDIILYHFFSEKKFKELLENLDEKFNLTTGSLKNVSGSKEYLFFNMFFEEINKFKEVSYFSFQKDLKKTLKIYEKIFQELNHEKSEIKKEIENLKEIKDFNFCMPPPIILININSTLEKIEQKEDLYKRKDNNKGRQIKSILKDNTSKISESIEYIREEQLEQEYLRMNLKETKVK